MRAGKEGEDYRGMAHAHLEFRHAASVPHLHVHGINAGSMRHLHVHRIDSKRGVSSPDSS
jgi:hypothetical protein